MPASGHEWFGGNAVAPTDPLSAVAKDETQASCRPACNPPAPRTKRKPRNGRARFESGNFGVSEMGPAGLEPATYRL